MSRTLAVSFILAICLLAANATFSQCMYIPPPAACQGTEPLLSDNSILTDGTTKWYYGSAVVYNQLTVRGGTLIVCGELTVNNFFIDSGTVIVLSGGYLKLGGGAGIQLWGKSSIYNYGKLDIYSVVSLENAWAGPTRPNIVANMTPGSVLFMTNYFVINNPYSFFINKGLAEFWGIVTDYNAAPASVCLGKMSQTKMSVLINNKKNTYVAPEGGACLHVSQFSSFRDTLTNMNNVNVCTGNSHTSDACSGCRPNAWGTPHRFAFCGGCNTITILKADLTDFALSEIPAGYQLSWKTSSPPANTVFTVERSTDGITFQPIDSVVIASSITATAFSVRDVSAPAGILYYRLKHSQPAEGQYTYSQVLKTVHATTKVTVTIFPNPFVNQLQVLWSTPNRPRFIHVVNTSGTLYYSRAVEAGSTNKLTIQLPAAAPAGEYFIKLIYADGLVVKRVLKTPKGQ